MANLDFKWRDYKRMQKLHKKQNHYNYIESLKETVWNYNRNSIKEQIAKGDRLIITEYIVRDFFIHVLKLSPYYVNNKLKFKHQSFGQGSFRMTRKLFNKLKKGGWI